MKIGDLVIDPTGEHKGIGIIKDVDKSSDWHQMWILWVLWLHGSHPYSTGCRATDVEVLNEGG